MEWLLHWRNNNEEWLVKDNWARKRLGRSISRPQVEHLDENNYIGTGNYKDTVDK